LSPNLINAHKFAIDGPPALAYLKQNLIESKFN
jgi:hypothetical protein